MVIYEKAGLSGSLGRCHASGTEILTQLGAESVATGKPIFYTSADSVFQIAADEESFADVGTTVAKWLEIKSGVGEVICVECGCEIDLNFFYDA